MLATFIDSTIALQGGSLGLVEYKWLEYLLHLGATISGRGARVDAARVRLDLQAPDDFLCDSLDDGGDVRDALLRRAALDLRSRRAALDVRGCSV